MCSVETAETSTMSEMKEFASMSFMRMIDYAEFFKYCDDYHGPLFSVAIFRTEDERE